ncbi:hypothetical protein F2Q70_00033679 [Brassica cretica]|uniref:Probable magnesium transporter n=1 Tax=Brassica cretica TaxID=69181 RepID=A0A8S9JWS7_BRACR|nr:hypothetical protein F2Q68_00028542 [Brassica cretica]KAF2586269.1 hypothetical protein F2Q70_00033679 [Brassica cretica]
MVTDNDKGLVLAVASSVFVGSSFILKKKGLKRAAADGTPAVAFGEIANFVAYVYAPAVLVTPLGDLSIIISAVLAHFLLNEKLRKMGVWGCVCCIVGSVMIVTHAPQEHTPNSVDEIWKLAMQPAFLIYVATSMSIVLALILYCEPLCGQINILVYTGICSSMGSLTALDTFNAAIVSPIYYVMFTTLTIVASAIMFKDWYGQNTESIASEICGFITVLTGTVILHATREEEETSSGTLRWQESGKSFNEEHLVSLYSPEY